MNFNQKAWFLALFTFAAFSPVFSTGQVYIEIGDADDVWSADIEATDPATNPTFELPLTEPVICHADEVWTTDFESFGNKLSFPSDMFDLPIEAVICRADEKLTVGVKLELIDSNQEVGTETITGIQEWGEDKFIDKRIVIATGAELNIKKGIKITFQENGSLVVYGNLIAKGTVKNPIWFYGQNSYSGTIMSVFDSGAANLRNVEFSTSLTDGLPSRQTAISVFDNGKLEIQGGNINNNSTGIRLERVFGNNIKVNRSKFNGNIIDVDNSNFGDNYLVDFGWNQWGDAVIYGEINHSNQVEGELRDPVIIIPGVLGSWPENGELKIDPIFHSFDNLIAQFEANGYVKGVNLFEFSYDWHNSNVVNAQLLRYEIDQIRAKNGNWPKVDIVAHSMGGLLAREYIESDYYQGDVDQLITIATPNNGSPQSYLTWEAGDSGTSVSAALFGKILSQEVKEYGFSDTFSYVRAKVPSAAELLPNYNYLYEADSGNTRQYPNGYPVNEFLDNLNSAENIEKLKAVEYDKIVAKLGDEKITITGFKVESTDKSLKWEHGYPVGYDNPLDRDGGITKGDGDDTVPIVSSQSANIPADEVVTVDSKHSEAVSNSRQYVMELLLGYRADAPGVGWQTPNLMLIQVFSPVDIQVVAPDNSWSGKNIIGLPESNRIEDAYYTGYDTEVEFIAIPNPLEGKYQIIAQGTGTGNYVIETTKIYQNVDLVEATMTSAVVEGAITTEEKISIGVSIQGDEITAEKIDTLPPVISVFSPENDSNYLNIGTLSIEYEVSDNNTINSTVNLYLDSATTTLDIDLPLQATGNHSIKVEAWDEAGNKSEKLVKFTISASVDSILSNINYYESLGLLKKSQRVVLVAQLKALKAQLVVLDKLQANTKLPARTKIAAITALEKTINKQIDSLIILVEKMAGRGVGDKAAELLIDSLKYVKID